MFATIPNTRKGFTLVEMIVSVFMFTIVMLVAVGALTTVLDANRKAQANKVVMNNLHFALESMTREMRVGSTYEAVNGDSLFSFRDKDTCDISYELYNGAIVRSVVDATTGCTKSPSALIPLTAPELTIDTLQFYVFGEEPGSSGDNEQPHVIIIVRGVAGQTARTQVPFNLETVVTQRFLDR